MTKPAMCKVCKCAYLKTRPLQTVCSPPCALVLARKATDKAHAKEQAKDRKETRQKLDAIKTKSEYMKNAQKDFNAYRRELLKNEPCISCGRHHTGQYHAGHYRSVGSAPELRFEELNVWKQCQPCNTHLSGNLINYRKALLEKIGLEALEWLEGNHGQKKYSIDDLKSIAHSYRIKLKQIRSESNGY